jgi:hypothetical protein
MLTDFSLADTMKTVPFFACVSTLADSFHTFYREFSSNRNA